MQETIAVSVWDKSVEIRVTNKSKTVWTASGSYHGETFSVTSQTRGSAIKRWVDAARYKGG